MIEVKGLTKRYGRHLAVDNISFTIQDGEIVGFLGPNGAGKTTTMNIITGYLSPSEGTAIVSGFDIIANPLAAKAGIGYLPDIPPLYPNMTVWEYLNFVADIKKVKKAGRKEHLEEIMEMVKIGDMRNRINRNLSKGYRQRVGLCQAMVGNPAVIILDEPTSGLDPKQIIEMRAVITELGKKHTVILSSHILSEVAAVCDRIMIINKGKIVASDTPDKLTNAVSGQNRVQIRAKGGYEDIAAAFNGADFIKTMESAGSKEEGCADAVLVGDESMDIRELVYKNCVNNNLTLLSMKNLDLTLEEIFLNVTATSSMEGLETDDEFIDEFDGEWNETDAESESAENVSEDNAIAENLSEEIQESAQEENKEEGGNNDGDY